MAFYRSARNKEALLKEYISEKAYIFTYEKMQLLISDLEKYFEELFSYCLKNKDFFDLLEKNGLIYLCKEIVDVYYANAWKNSGYKKEIDEYESGYFSGALFNIFLLWQKNGMKESPEKLAKLYCDISSNGLNFLKD